MDGQRVRALNGKVTPLAEHLAVLPVVAWTAAAEAEVLVGAPKARRRFMDRGVVGIRPVALEVLGRYREALRQKRGLLLSDGAGIEIWNEMLAATAADVIAQRHRYVELLKVQLAQVLAASGLQFPAIELRYRPSPASGLEGQTVIADALDRIADRERRRQMPLLGPHRDELEILWGGHEIRRVASAGERKALSLMLLAAHGKVMEEAGQAPALPARRHGRRAGAADRDRRLGDLPRRGPALRHLQPPAGLADPGRGDDLGDGAGRAEAPLASRANRKSASGNLYLPFIVAVVPEGSDRRRFRSSSRRPKIGSKLLKFQR